MSDPVATVTAFNDAINRRDPDALAALMTDTHRFVDAAGSSVEGKAACVEVWRGFFEAYPDYRNVFDELVPVGDGVVEVGGHSECREPALDGPARWRAVVRDGLVEVWQVTEG
jgi:ketosteroid isomerase-like protein